MLKSLGSDYLANLLLEQAVKDPDLLERLRPALPARAQPPATVENNRTAPRLVGRSPAMQRVRETLAKFAATRAPVLITGESGTGKEVAAHFIHAGSPCASGPFVAINCAALPPTLIASELFGHEKGAFTGADQRRIGRLQAADGGTVFLDEIGDLPLDLQAHLLRFLQEGTIDRVGGSQPITVNARIVAATNVPLRQAVAEGRFREDLFYRLNVLSVEMPPLRERGDDVILLFGHFLERFAAEIGRPVHGLSQEAAQVVQTHPWPGNIRELIACVRRAVVMAEGEWIQAEDLGLPPPPRRGRSGLPMLKTAREEVEESLIRKALTLHRRNITRAAEQLGISRVTLYRLIEKYEIPLPSETQGGTA
ncbi:sigma-54-dependent Fis family transcriptional regulator [Telmatospirillum sp. J64-1]|uniref:sigma-54 interaction domain-containing protein n=1 Tax=Telmatospirillum sp. J64-1 TaxID=2502183 RepID=UPI0021025EEC|nr:sigma-54 dependent transcriptional regulator [Telmatospirillum sp. J64-1]